MDERQWLLATAYNTGTECLQSVDSLLGVNAVIVYWSFTCSSAALFDEARRWFEAATVICRFVPGGRERSEKVGLLMLVLCSIYLGRTGLIIFGATHPDIGGLFAVACPIRAR
jgi:hypothetical protein